MTAAGVPEAQIINSLVGDVQRMAVYATLRYQTPPCIPPDTLAAFEALVAAGYDRYIVREM